MAELTGKAVSELPEATDAQDSDLLAISQDATSKKVTVGTLLKRTISKQEINLGPGAKAFNPQAWDNAVALWTTTAGGIIYSLNIYEGALSVSKSTDGGKTFTNLFSLWPTQ